MMTFAEFRISPMCGKLVLPEEDTPQNISVYRRIVAQHEKDQYAQYVAQQKRVDKPGVVEVTSEEKAVTEKLKVLRNKKKVLRNKSRAEYYREWRKRKAVAQQTVRCPRCGEKI